jgi:hypothetical protein
VNFDPANIAVTTLCGYFEDDAVRNLRHVQIPIAPNVQQELQASLRETITKLGLPASAARMPRFQPAEKYASEEHVKVALATEYLQGLRDVVALRNLPSDANALRDVAELEYYYAVFVDNQNRTLHAFRRASQFKGILKSKLAFIDGGVLTMSTRQVFRLDNDFDYLVDNDTVYILRPSGFEFTTNVHTQVLAAAAANAASIQATAVFLDLTGIGRYASTHARSARLLAAIKSRDDLHLISRNLLASACRNYGIAIQNPRGGLLCPDAGHEYDFLCILDRRAYIAKLITNQPERYEAASRVQK